MAPAAWWCPGYSGIIIADLEGREGVVRRAVLAGRAAVRRARPKRWGFSLTYTLGEAEQTGGDQFSLDFPTVADYPRYPTSTDERHRRRDDRHRRAAVGLHRAACSSRSARARPTRSTTNREAAGPTSGNLRNEGRPEQFDFIIPNAWAYRSVDLQVEKAFRFGDRSAFSVIFQGFNIFSFDNFSGYSGNIPTLPPSTSTSGRPSSLIDPGPATAVRVEVRVSGQAVNRESGVRP